MSKRAFKVMRGGQPALPPPVPTRDPAKAAPSLSLEDQATMLLDQVLYGDWEVYIDAWQAMLGPGGIPDAAERMKQAWRWELEQIVKRLRKTPESVVLLHLALLGLELVRWQQLVIESGWSPDGLPIEQPQIVPAGLVIEEPVLAQWRSKRDAPVPETTKQEDQ